MAEERNILDMSDEELLALDPSTFTQEAETPPEQEQEQEASESDNPQAWEGEAAPEGQQNGAGSSGESAQNEENQSEEQTPAADASTEGSAAIEAKGNEESNPKEQAAEPTKVEEPAIDYKAAYEKLTAPFKANGREIQIKDVNDAVSLMQMGANYNKKMAALKPNLKLMKLLENNGLLNEEKLSFLIDLEKKNPDAISKLIKDSGVDPLDLDATKAGDYKPTQHKVDDRELELDAVLDEIQDTDSYPRTLDVISNKWDAASKNIIANSPQILKVINGHVQSGVFDLIVREVEREQMFGRLSGLSDIEAYRQVGDAIQARGGFDHLAPQGQRIQPKPVVVQPKPKMGDEGKRREKRLAASPSQSVAPAKDEAAFNPLALSDEEFNKVVNQRLL
jgi:hypothetical protein